jgi:hypothetical protein
MLDNITDVAYQQGFIERSCGVSGTIKVENPGQSGRGEKGSGSDLTVTGLADPHLVKRVLLQMRHRVRYGHNLDVHAVRAILNGESFVASVCSDGKGLPAQGCVPPIGIPASLNPANMAPVCEILVRIEALLRQQQQQQQQPFPLYTPHAPPMYSMP